MSAWLDGSLVGFLLVSSTLYAFAKLGPAIARRRILSLLAALLSRTPRALGLRPAAQRLGRAAAANAQGACGGCDSCGSANPQSAANPEIRVPVGRIGRRTGPRRAS